MIGRRLLVLGTVLGRVAPAIAQPAPPAGNGRTPLLVPGKKSLYQRVITRPGATMTSGPGTENAQPIPAFAVYYVYRREGGDSAWIEVGSAADGRTQGWVPAAKTIDWRHTMIGAFTNPAGRQPVLFMDSATDARRLILDANASATVEALRRQVAAGNPGPVVALEPNRWVDITHSFYLLPILGAELIERDVGPPVRLLEVISVPAEPPPPEADTLRNFKAALVFLIDTTLSMQPYIDGTRDAVKSIVARIGGTALKDNFRFGVVAYRDSLEDTPNLEYPTKIYAQPDFSKPPDSVVPAMADIQQARVSSIGFDEDPIGGLNAVLNEINWGPASARYVVLITDSGARPSTHPHSLTHLGITEIREKARASHVTVMTVHLLTAEGDSWHDHEPARAQYQELTEAGAQGSLYFPVAHGAPEAFRTTVDLLVTSLLQQVSALTGVPVATLQIPRTAASDPQQARVREQMAVVGEAMRLSYLGRMERTQAPDVARSWTADRDLADSTIASLDVRVLLTRNQLSDLANALQTILRPGLAGRTDPQTFFTQLRSAFAQTVNDPQRIAQASRIGTLLGEYLEDLPYKSEILDITEADWLAMGSIAQRSVLNNVESRLRLYQEFQRQTDLWKDLTHSGLPGEAVYPVPIEALP